jgi:rhodanese-related sulfurtransferase
MGTAAAVLGLLAAAVGAPVRSDRALRDPVSAATRDALDSCTSRCGALDCARDEGAMSFRASEASRVICTSISAVQLAQWIRDGRSGLRVLDLRDSSAFQSRHIPSAESFDLMGLPTVLPTPEETLVLYSDDDVRDAQGLAWLSAVGHRRLHVVRGGMHAWMTEVIDPVVSGDSAAAVAALSRYFGGVPRAATREDARDVRAARTSPKVPVRNATDEFGFAARRGC